MPLLTTGAGKFGGAAAFTPASLSGLIGWYDASVASSMRHSGAQATNGQVVDQLNDLSGAGNNLTVIAALTGPTLNTTGFNTSYPTMVFGTGIGLEKTSYAIGTGTTLTAFVVAQMNTATGAYARLLAYTKPTAGSSFDNQGSAAILIRNAGSNQVEIFANSGTSTAANLSLDTPAIFGSIFTGSVFSVYMNNVRAGTGDTYNQAWVSAGKMQLGVDDSGAVWIGPVSEVIISTADCTSDATNIYNYLKAKWGL